MRRGKRLTRPDHAQPTEGTWAMADGSKPHIASARKPAIVSGARPATKSALWTPERTLALRRLVVQCGPNLCRTIMAIDLDVRGNMKERVVERKLKEMGIEGTRI